MFDLYSLVKAIHILAVSLMVGATLINGILHSLAIRSDAAGAVVLLGGIVTINRWVMGPSFILLPLSGFWMSVDADISLSTFWLLTSIILTGALILAFLVGVPLENGLHRMAQERVAQGKKDLPSTYGISFRKAAPIGGGAALMSLLTIYLMTAKPF